MSISRLESFLPIDLTYLWSIKFSLPSLFWPQFHSGNQFLATAKNRHFLRFFLIVNFFRRVFSECTEAITTSPIPLDTILPEKCGFSCTVWTKMKSLAGSLADGVLVDAILIPPRPPIPHTNIMEVRGRQKVQT